MRIAILTDGTWPSTVGGMQKHSYYLCKYLLASGVNVDLYYTRKQSTNFEDPERLFGFDETAKLRCFYIPYPKSVYFPGHYLWELYSYSKRISCELLNNIGSCDFVYAQGLSGWYTILHKVKVIGTVPVLSNFHGLNMFQKVVNKQDRFQQVVFKPLVKGILNRADYVQSLGGQLTNLLIHQGIKKEKIIELAIGIDESWVTSQMNSQPGKRRSFTFIGRSERLKGIRELNNAILKLIPEHDFTFDFVGPVSESEKIIYKQIKYHGIIRDEDEIKRILDRSDFLVLPSYSEGMPTVILEAMARGCAVIATNVGAISEQISSLNGILIEPENSDAIYNALVEGITIEADRLNNMKSCSLQIVKSHFLWDRLIKKMIAFFSQVTKNEP